MRRYIYVLALKCITAAFAADKDDQKPLVTATPQPNYTLISSAFSHPPITPDERAVEALKEIVRKKPAEYTTADVIKLYQNIHYETVRTLPEHGLRIKGTLYQLSPEQSRALAIVRDIMINETYKLMARDFGIDFTRLDFGNKNSGLKSDVDHTAYTEFLHEKFKGQNIRTEFEKRFQRYGISQAACDICVHSGRNSVPDWRGTESVAEFDARMIDVLRGLAGTPDAYVAEGSWRQQVEGRSIEGKDKVLKKLADINEELKTTGLSDEQRKSLEAEKAKAIENNPCTKFKSDGKGGVTIEKDTSILSELFRGVKGDVLRMYSFDSTVGNFLFHIHHGNKLECTKYVLRSFEEGVSLLRNIPEGQTLKPIDYYNMDFETQRTKLINELFPDKIGDRPGFTEEQRTQIKLILDVAAKIRANHKSPGSPPHDAKDVWRDMVEHMRKRTGDRTANATALLHAAQREYDRLSTQVMLWNIQRTSTVRSMSWLQPTKMSEADAAIIKLAFPGATAEKLSRSGFYALKYAFATLPPEHANLIIQGAPLEHRRDLLILRDVVHTEIAQYGRVNLDPGPEQQKSIRERLRQSYDDVKKGWAQSYTDFKTAVAKEQFTDEAINARVWATVYEHLGMEYEVSRNALTQEIPRWTGNWDAATVFKNMANAGNVLSALNVLRVYQEGGDKDAVIATMIWEGLYRIPGACHLLAVRDAWHGNWHGVKFLATSAAMDRVQKYALKHGIEWAKPLGGHALIYLMIAKTGVEMVGYEIFQPLTDDLADMMYLGRIGPPKVPADKFTDEDQARLPRLERMLDENTKKIGDPTIVLTPEERQKIIEDSRGYRETIQELKKKKKVWDDYQKEVDRWKAGIIRSGIKEQIDAPFDPVIGPKVPLKFYIGEIDGDTAGPVDLEAKPLTDAERNRRENAVLTVIRLAREGGDLDPFERIETIVNLRDEIDEFTLREKAAARAQRYLERLRADEKLLFDARRQNLCYVINPILDQRVPPPAKKDATYYTAREKAAPGVVKEYVEKWFNEEHPQTRSIGMLSNALVQVTARLQRDYESSEQAREWFEDFESAQLTARSFRREERRVDLQSQLVQQGIRNQLGAAKEFSNANGLWTLAGNTPVADPVVKLTGVVSGEGADKSLKLRVKVIASPFHFKEPFKYKFKNKVVERRPDGTQVGGIIAEVFDADGKLVGTNEVATVVEPLKETVTAANALQDWPIPLKLVVTQKPEGKIYYSTDELDIAANLPGVPIGDYALTVTVGDRAYHAWGKAERIAGTAFFKCRIAVPPGKSKITLAVPNVPSVAFDIEKDARTSPDLTSYKDALTKARDALNTAKNRATKDADDEARKKREIENTTSNFIDAARRYARELFDARKDTEAGAALNEALQAMGTGEYADYRRRINETLAAIAFRSGTRADYLTAARELLRLSKADLANNRKDNLPGVISLYDKLISYIASLGGGAGDLKPLWNERAGFVKELYGEDTVPEPHPDWGPE